MITIVITDEGSNTQDMFATPNLRSAISFVDMFFESMGAGRSKKDTFIKKMQSGNSNAVNEVIDGFVGISVELGAK